MKELDQHIHDLFLPLLDESENIVYAEDNKWKRGPFQNDTLFAVSVVTTFMLVIYNSSLIIPFVSIVSLYILLTEQGRLSTFAITQKKVIILYKKKSAKYVYFSEVNRIDNSKFKIIIERQFKDPLSKKKKLEVIKFIPKEETQFVKRRLVNQWSRKSTYAQMNKVFKSFATKHQLDFTPFRRSGSHDLYLTGDINERKFSLSLKSMFNLNQLIIKIQCKNYTNNLFNIFHESDRNWIKNIVGIEDHEIGTYWFDEKYIIQGNHYPFLASLLEEDILEELDMILMKFKGKLSLENHDGSLSSRTDSIKENQTLDEHLFLEDLSIPYHEAPPKSYLTYTTKNLHYESDLSILAEDILEMANLMLKIEERIQVYFRK